MGKNRFCVKVLLFGVKFLVLRVIFSEYGVILDVKVDETNFVLINIYNPNTETEEVTTLLDLGKMLETI